MKLPLGRPKDTRFGIIWNSCSPFIENSMAVLIHRPRYVVTHKISEKHKAHIAIHCWCGTGFTGTKKFTFLDAPPDGKLLCARCEERAVEFGQPSSSSLTGKHVHVGKVIAKQLCCQSEDTP